MSGIAQPLDSCPDENAWLAYLAGTLPPERSEALRGHLDGCDKCRPLLAALVREMVPPEPDPQSEPLLPPGTMLGRYRVESLLGRGGMGVVYAAFDPTLHRSVALKVLRARPLEDPHDPRASSLLLAEAQTVARLSHPNVITLYDVGTTGDDVFFAMERVVGPSLREAVARAPRSWRRTLSLYVAAGRGLAAAHEAGLVHRDFKPENVLVGDDGRVRVTDFGLAAIEAAHRRMGTAAYAAPEQWSGKGADARSDQYSFCVSLFEALTGNLPGRSTSTALPLPAGLMRSIERGFSPRPEDRWPSMNALLEALGRSSRRVEPLPLLLCVLVVLAAVAATVRHQWMLRTLEQELRAASSELPDRLALQHSALDAQLRSAMKSPALLEVFERANDMDAALGLASTEEVEQELSVAHELVRSADLSDLKSADALLIVNGWGRVVFSLTDEGRFGQAASDAPLLQQTLAGQSSESLWSSAQVARVPIRWTRAPSGDALLWVSARPVMRGASTMGAIWLGRWYSAEALAPLEAVLRARIVLRSPDGSFSSAGQSLNGASPGFRLIHVRGLDAAVICARLDPAKAAVPEGTACLYRELSEAMAGDVPLAVRVALLVAALVALGAMGRRLWRLA